jgi:xanthine dehydrogenase accessory factor
MWDWIGKLAELSAQGQPFVAITLTQSTGSAPREVGAKMIVCLSGDFYGTIGGGRLEEEALLEAVKCLKEGTSRSIRYPLGAKTGQCCGGVVDLFFDVLNQGPRLYLFGAGHVGQAVARAFSGTPFCVHVIDERADWVNSPEIPKSAVRFHGEWDDFIKDAAFDSDKTYVAVMTHRHDTDQDIIEKMLDRPYRYLGLIGSHSKWERFKQRLTAKGVSMDKLERVKCPIGLDIGGKSPQEVAISLAAELLKIHYHGR